MDLAIAIVDFACWQIWVDKNKKGENNHGKILMELREEFRVPK